MSLTDEMIEAGLRARSLLADLARAFEPFLDLRHQNGAHGVISKDLEGMAPLTITVTKAQMLAALAAHAKVRGDA